MHYILVEGKDGKDNSLPLTVWFNGGPGCSSKIGFLHEIGPYILREG
jgi:carboxypeptidase C (cathepsin A)